MQFPAILVAMVFVAMTPASLGQDQQFEPFQENGVITEGINVAYAIEAAGEMWNAARFIDALAYSCNSVLPRLTSAFPSWKPLCDPIEQGAAADSFNPMTTCENIIHEIMTLITTSMLQLQGGSKRRKRRQSGDDFSVIQILPALFESVYDIYGINAFDPNITSDPSVICATADRFLVPSLPDQISSFATELLSGLGNEYLCTNWDSLIAKADIDGVDKSTEFNQLADVGATAAGFTSRADLCEQLGPTVSATATERKTRARSAIESIFRLFTEASQCKSTSSEVIEIMKSLNSNITAALSDANILKYTGYISTNAVCDAMGAAFNT